MAIDLRIRRDGYVIDQVNGFGQMALDPGAGAKGIALVEFHTQRNTCGDELRRLWRQILSKR